MTIPLARSTEEALLYLDLNPCTCGESDLPEGAPVRDGTGTLRCFCGPCPRCGTHREFVFRVPAEQPAPAPDGGVRYGGDQPSELFDPGMWMLISDGFARRYPADPARIPPGELRKARNALACAAAAMDEVAKFIPEGADEVPESAFTTPRGLAVYLREPHRFQRSFLTAARTTYRYLMAALPALPPPAAARAGRAATPPALPSAPPATVPPSAPARDAAGTAAAVRMLSGGQVRALARQMLMVRWLLGRADAREIAVRLGWRMCDEPAAAGMLAMDSRSGVAADRAYLWLDDDQQLVTAVSVPVCDIAALPGAACGALVLDALALAAGALAEEFGPPTHRTGAEQPRISWRRDVVTLCLWKRGMVANLSMELNADLDARAAVGH